MAKFTPDIMEGDDESDAEYFFLQTCGIEDKNKLTKEIWEANIDKILEIIKQYSRRNAVYLVFGYFILLLGADLPSYIRPKILESADWENEKEFWSGDDALERKFYLDDLKEKILNYKSGKPIHLVQLKNFAECLKNGILGLDQFWK